jgi:hypothetical protein
LTLPAFAHGGAIRVAVDNLALTIDNHRLAALRFGRHNAIVDATIVHATVLRRTLRIFATLNFFIDQCASCASNMIQLNEPNHIVSIGSERRERREIGNHGSIITHQTNSFEMSVAAFPYVDPIVARLSACAFGGGV